MEPVNRPEYIKERIPLRGILVFIIQVTYKNEGKHSGSMLTVFYVIPWTEFKKLKSKNNICD